REQLCRPRRDRAPTCVGPSGAGRGGVVAAAGGGRPKEGDMTRQFLMSAMLVALLATLTASSTSAQGYGSAVQANDRRDISVAVGPDVSSVPATASFTGRERWDFQLNNVSGPPLTGAQISVNSAYDLTDSNLFRFLAFLQTFPAPPGPPTEVPCSVTQNDAACPPSPSQALPTATNLGVQANALPPPPPPPTPPTPTPPWLAPGVPTSMTPGFDSSVSESAFAGGTATVHVLVTLRDVTRYGSAVSNDSQTFVQVDGNPVPGSALVTTSSGPVPPCGSPAPGLP